MNAKKMTLILTLAAIGAASAFASGSSDDTTAAGSGTRGGYGRGMHGGGMYGGMRTDYGYEIPEPSTIEGSFIMVDGIYPALDTADGERIYLMIRFPIAEENIPADGDAVSIQAIPAPMSPVHVMVLSAEVNGTPIEADWPEDGTYPAKPGFGGYGGRFDDDFQGGRGARGAGRRPGAPANQ